MPHGEMPHGGGCGPTVDCCSERAVTILEGDTTVIIRISRGRIRAGTEAEVFARLRGASEAGGLPAGLEAFFVGRHLTADGLEMVAITVWSDIEALIGVMGDGWESPRWLAGVDELVTHSSVEHFETALEDFEALGAPGSAPVESESAADGQVYGG